MNCNVDLFAVAITVFFLTAGLMLFLFAFTRHSDDM